MDKLNRIGMFCLVLVLLVGGCGKKKKSTITKDKVEIAKKVSKRVAQADASTNIPLLDEGAESLVDDTEISSFAFLDDDVIIPDQRDEFIEGKVEEVVAFDDQSTSANVVEISTDRNNFELETNISLSEGEQIESFIFETIQFDFNKDSIRSDQRKIVSNDIEVAQQAVEQGKKVVIEGHCDQMGPAPYNLALSQCRAEVVKREMVKSGIPASSVKTLGYGYEKPIVWSDKTGRLDLIRELAPNRRAELLVN